MNIANRLSKVKPSATLAMSARAKALKASGKDVISLAAGEPDFDTPEYIKEAAREALNSGKTKYTPVSGTPALKEAISSFFSEIYGHSFETNQIMVCAGAKHALFNLCHALLEPGDEAVVISPYWVSYPDMIHLQNAETKIVESTAENNFIPDIQDIEKTLSSKTKLLFLNSPNNPTGTVYPTSFYQQLAVLLEQYPDCYIVSDDIYHGLIYDSDFRCLFHDAPSLRHRTLLINGVSKTYAMTGWRVGFLIGPADLVEAMSRIQGASTSGICSIAQAAAGAALLGSQAPVDEMHAHFAKRRDFIYSALNDLPGIAAVKPQGAFYIFPDFSHYLGKQYGNTLKLCEHFLEEGLVACVAGEGFGANGFIRMSFATSEKDIEEAVSRIQLLLKRVET